MTKPIGTGLEIAFESGFLATITDVTPPASSRPSIDTSHYGTSTYRTFIPGDLIDNGQLQCTIEFDPGQVPPIDQDASTVTITFRNDETWEFSGFMTDYQPGSPMEERMTASCVIKVSGAITIET